MELRGVQIRKCLIVNLGGIGDIMLSLPAVRAVREALGGAPIDALVVGRAAAMAENAGFFRHIFRYEGYSAATVKALMALRKERYDLTVNMRTMVSPASAFKMRALFSLIGGKLWAGRDTNGRGGFFDISIPEAEPGEKHEMEYDVDLAGALGVTVGDRSISLAVDSVTAEKVARLLAAEGIAPDEAVIGIHPGGIRNRRWPLDRFAEVMGSLGTSMACRFIITGTHTDTVLARALVRAVGARVIDLTGRLTISELAAVIGRCRVYIANDTGPMHLAAVLGTPLVAIFGPGQLVRYDPRHLSDKATVLYAPATCAPCSRIRCGSMSCLKNIAAEDVASAATSLLRKE